MSFTSGFKCICGSGSGLAQAADLSAPDDWYTDGHRPWCAQNHLAPNRRLGDHHGEKRIGSDIKGTPKNIRAALIELTG